MQNFVKEKNTYDRINSHLTKIRNFWKEKIIEEDSLLNSNQDSEERIEPLLIYNQDYIHAKHLPLLIDPIICNNVEPLLSLSKPSNTSKYLNRKRYNPNYKKIVKVNYDIIDTPII